MKSLSLYNVFPSQQTKGAAQKRKYFRGNGRLQMTQTPLCFPEVLDENPGYFEVCRPFPQTVHPRILKQVTTTSFQTQFTIFPSLYINPAVGNQTRRHPGSLPFEGGVLRAVDEFRFGLVGWCHRGAAGDVAATDATDAAL